MRRLGIGMHSYGFHWKAGRFDDALTFLAHAHDLGAAGVQVMIGQRDIAYTRKLRQLCAQWDMYIEAQASLPADEASVPRFTAEVQTAVAAGATVMRTAMLSGRRYETFNSVGDFQAFAAKSWKSLTLAEPVAKKHGIRLAIENHKDWLIPELIAMIRKISSAHVGVCVDTGNSIALLEGAREVVEAYAPYAITTHIKDMGVARYADGFLLSEVPIGRGFLDLASLVQILQRAKPAIRWNLEMITRDPLEVPCLREKYWATLGRIPASQLAKSEGIVRARQTELPRVSHLDEAGKLKAENDNVRESLAAFAKL